MQTLRQFAVELIVPCIVLYSKWTGRISGLGIMGSKQGLDQFMFLIGVLVERGIDVDREGLPLLRVEVHLADLWVILEDVTYEDLIRPIGIDLS